MTPYPPPSACQGFYSLRPPRHLSLWTRTSFEDRAREGAGVLSYLELVPVPTAGWGSSLPEFSEPLAISCPWVWGGGFALPYLLMPGKEFGLRRSNAADSATL